MNARTIMLAAVSAVLVLAANAQAGIIVSDLGGQGSSSSGTSQIFDPTDILDASSTQDILIVSVSSKQLDFATSVTYGGQALTLADDNNDETSPSGQDGPWNYASVWYLLNPSQTDGVIQVEWDGWKTDRNNVIRALYADGVVGPEGTNSVNGDFAPSLTVSVNASAGSLVVDAAAVYNGTLGGSGLGNGYEAAGGGASYTITQPAGTVTSTWTRSSNYEGGANAGAIASFVAVPEPATMSLLALVGLALIRRPKA